MDTLVERANLIVVGRIETVGTVDTTPCPPMQPKEVEGGWVYEETYRKCGQVWLLKFRATDSLKGTVSRHIEVLVAPELLGLPCDDRPLVEKMAGHDAVLFVEVSGRQFWTLDGPNSIHIVGPGITKAGVDDLKRTLRGIYKTPTKSK